MKNQIEKRLPQPLISIRRPIRADVVWADGIQDSGRDCNICETQMCIKPVHAERYKIINDKLAKKWDDDNPVV